MQLNAPAMRTPLTARLRAHAGALHHQLRRRQVYRTLAAYVVAAAGTIQLGDVLSHVLPLPPHTAQFLVIAAAAGLPLALAGAWLFNVRRERAAAQPPEALAAPPALPAGYVNNLREQPTPFVGRHRELDAVAQALARPGSRLVTVTGPGGMGKTRLALEAARRALPEFAHGVCVVPLAGVRSPELIAPAVAASLGMTLSAREDPSARVLEYLREKRLLLVLDNFEHLTGGAPLVGQVLQAAAGVRALVTSRQRLGLAGEQLVPLEGMEVAGDEDGGDAVRLFLEGARRVRPGFDPTPQERAAIGRICALVEGLPLAIDLASPWVRMLRCDEIEAEIAASASAPHGPEGAVYPGTCRRLSAEERARLLNDKPHAWRLDLA
ncbi:MAG TPA: AAA family ATPase, partial [Longimicrobium sp.]